nr:formylglycine-generating enzyme family protein [Qipengyuania aurantiaca]
MITLSACSPKKESSVDSQAEISAQRKCSLPQKSFVRLESGEFLMGQEGIYSEEGPVRRTRVNGFWIDTTEVTNERFARFVEETGYVTIAEKPVDPALFDVPRSQIPAHMLSPGSAVFTPPSKASSHYRDWWIYLPGANWKKPFGPKGRDYSANEPAVHLAYQDMEAFAKWAGGRIPTEAEWEYAAKADAKPSREQPAEANSWQGVFPVANEKIDGFEGIAPVGCYKPNSNGLYDTVGNVWEMTADLYRAGHDPNDRDNPQGPSETLAYDPVNPKFPSRVIKGGSYLCAPNYCQRYRPASRSGRDPAMGASNVGFRLVYDRRPAHPSALGVDAH